MHLPQRVVYKHSICTDMLATWINGTMTNLKRFERATARATAAAHTVLHAARAWEWRTSLPFHQSHAGIFLDARKVNVGYQKGSLIFQLFYNRLPGP